MTPQETIDQVQAAIDSYSQIVANGVSEETALDQLKHDLSSIIKGIEVYSL